ncbi:MFS transporter [Actinomycetes bacterium NPDC127524]
MNKQDSKYRWIVFASVLLSYFLIVSQRTAPGLISDQLMKDFSVSASMIGLFASVQFFAYSGLQIPIGILSDRFGPNFFLIGGTLMNGLGTLLYSLAPDAHVLLIARMMAGVGDAAIWINLVLILSQWFRAQEFVGLLGMAGITGSLGFLFATVPFSVWISSAGWRPPFMTTGIILIVCSLVLYVVLEKKPKQMNFLSPDKKVHKREKTVSILRRVFFSRQAWSTFFCHFGVVGTYVGFIGSWAVPYGMHVYGMTRSHASQLIMIGLVGAIVGSILTSWISKRIDTVKRPYLIIYILVVLSWSMFLVMDGKPPFVMLVILFFIIGYGNGASMLTFVVVRQSFPITEVGVISGLANTGGFTSAILLPVIFGKVLDHYHASAAVTGYHYGFIIPVVFSLFGLFGVLLINEEQIAKRTDKQLSS